MRGLCRTRSFVRTYACTYRVGPVVGDPASRDTRHNVRRRVTLRLGLWCENEVSRTPLTAAVKVYKRVL